MRIRSFEAINLKSFICMWPGRAGFSNQHDRWSEPEDEFTMPVASSMNSRMRSTSSSVNQVPGSASSSKRSSRDIMANVGLNKGAALTASSSAQT